MAQFMLYINLSPGATVDRQDDSTIKDQMWNSNSRGIEPATEETLGPSAQYDDT